MRFVRVLLLIALLLCLLTIGYLQYSYVLNFTNFENHLLLKRNLFLRMEYRKDWLVSGSDPRAYSMLFYMITTILLTSGIIRLYFKEVKWAKFTILLYGLGYLLAGLIILFSFFTSNLETGMVFFQKIKNALSSSFVVFFLVPLFVYFEKNPPE